MYNSRLVSHETALARGLFCSFQYFFRSTSYMTILFNKETALHSRQADKDQALKKDQKS